MTRAANAIGVTQRLEQTNSYIGITHMVLFNIQTAIYGYSSFLSSDVYLNIAT